MSATTERALHRLRASTAGIWLVQCNPRVTDILATSRTAPPDAWCVRRHVHEIRRGDRVVLWLSGRGAGVYALGVVAAEVRAGPPPAGRASSKPVAQAPLDLFLDLFDRPVARDVLVADPRFAGESIVRQPFAANPHRLSAGAFEAILELIGAS
jgi:hypothetical protein